MSDIRSHSQLDLPQPSASDRRPRDPANLEALRRQHHLPQARIGSGQEGVSSASGESPEAPAYSPPNREQLIRELPSMPGRLARMRGKQVNLTPESIQAARNFASSQPNDRGTFDELRKAAHAIKHWVSHHENAFNQAEKDRYKNRLGELSRAKEDVHRDIDLDLDLTNHVNSYKITFISLLNEAHNIYNKFHPLPQSER